MMKSLLKILLLALAVGAVPPALAAKYDVRDLLGHLKGVTIADGKDHRDLTIAQSNGPSLSEAKRMVEQQCKCQVLDAKTRISGGREVHHIKIMEKNGTVRTVKIPGRSTNS